MGNVSGAHTEGDEFIWACSSADIAFAKPEWINVIIERII